MNRRTHSGVICNGVLLCVCIKWRGCRRNIRLNSGNEGERGKSDKELKNRI